MADAGDRPTVLVVEDEPLVRDIAVDELEDAGFFVLTADDDRSALAILDSDQPLTLLFTDIRIPGELDGWAIASRARTLRPALPVIYATGYSADQVRMVPGGVFFKKPYRMAAIIQAARQLSPLIAP